MMSSGIFISSERLNTLSEEERSYLLSLIFEKKIEGKESYVNKASSYIDDDIARLSISQAREFYNGCSDKVKKAIYVMVKSETNSFHIKDIAIAVNEDVRHLSGIWSGLTRRTRTITQNPKALLINWLEDTIEHDAHHNYIDQIGEISSETYLSFKNLLGAS